MNILNKIISLSKSHEPLIKSELLNLTTLKMIISEPINVIDNIYIGNIFNAYDWTIINKYKINTIISLDKNITSKFSNTHLKFYNMCELYDPSNLNNLLNNISDIQTCEDVLSPNRYKNILLVNIDGNNQPYIVILAFMMYKYNMELKTAEKIIKKKNKKYNIDKKYHNILKNKY